MRRYLAYTDKDENISYYLTYGNAGSADIVGMLPDVSEMTPEELGAIWTADLEGYDDRCNISLLFGIGSGGPTADVPLTADNYNQLKETMAKVEELTGEVRKLNIPKGVYLEQTSSEVETKAAMSETTVAIAASVFLVFMVMAIQFESVRYSLLVMMCLPFALIGAMSLHDALILAGKSRMRPILMTTLTTVLSMIPMVIPGAGGDPSMRGLAFVVIGGLTMATVLTLIILPIFYLFFCKKDESDRKPRPDRNNKKDKVAKKAAKIRKRKHDKQGQQEDLQNEELTFVTV